MQRRNSHSMIALWYPSGTAFTPIFPPRNSRVTVSGACAVNSSKSSVLICGR
ncbi:hypothetical protein GA0115252_176617 [Streptomyces sp. DfronAA-171]|nr:hypothetical protein GA0115252_176617 [Streptomyces sp. DfronAA-171]